MSRANLSNPLTIMHILANHHPPPTPSILADLPNPDPANGVQVQNQPLTRLEIAYLEIWALRKMNNGQLRIIFFG